MLERKTTIVLGAGASRELGLPLGVELQAQIHHALLRELEVINSAGFQNLHWREHPIGFALYHLGHSAALVSAAFEKMIAGVIESPSIDTFLFNNSDDELLVTVGKLAILNSILLGERRCFAFDAKEARVNFFPHDAAQRNIANPNYLNLPWQTFAVQNCYLGVLWSELSQRHDCGNLESLFQNLSVVNFNYDRSIEYVFSQKIAAAFPSSSAEARRDVIDSLHCIRPYGSPSGDRKYSAAKLPFAAADVSLRDHIDSIRTFTEALDPSVSDEIKSTISQSSVVVILGFAFHPQNLDLLTVDRSSSQKVFFSHFNGSRENVDAIRNDLAARMTRHAKNRSPQPETVSGFIGSSLQTLTSHHHAIFRSNA